MAGRRRRQGLGWLVPVAVLVLAVGVSRTCRMPRVRRVADVPPPAHAAVRPAKPSKVVWPGGAKCAVSLTFDHAYASQIDKGMRILDAYALKATFYVDIAPVQRRPVDWRRAVASGHEIGNHTLSHPCSSGYKAEREKENPMPLESVTPEWMEGDIMAAGAEIKRLLGVTPRTFAYPCGETYTGWGQGVRSYVPVVARNFIVGRGFGLDFANRPGDCDLAKVNALASDGYSHEMYMAKVRQAMKDGDWVVFCGHAISETKGRISTIAPEFGRFCDWLANNRGKVWTATVAEVGEYIVKSRAGLAGGGN